MGIFYIIMMVISIPCTQYLTDEEKNAPFLYLIGLIFAPLTIGFALFKWLINARI